MLKLHFKDGQHDPVWVVEKGFTIGSADDNSLVIDDASVSPQHARLSGTFQTFILKDLGSAEGTFVNGGQITQHAISIGDTIQFGEVAVTVVDPSKEDKDYTWSLIGSSNFLAGQEFPLKMNADDEVIVGRGKRCDIAFPGTHLSKNHARFTQSEDGLLVEDLGSDNGVFINDERTEKALLHTGDKVRLDIYSFVVFGPDIDGPKASLLSATSHDTDQETTEETDTVEPTKQWITRPTSPGNREEPTAPSKVPLSLYAFSALMIALLIGLSAYIFL